MKMEPKRLVMMLLVVIAVMAIMTISVSAETTVIKGKVTKIVHHVSTGTSDVTVTDCNGNDHVFTIPLVEGEKLKVGDNVEVTVVKDKDGNITSITIEKTNSNACVKPIPEFPTIALPALAILGLVFVVLCRNEKGRKGN